MGELDLGFTFSGLCVLRKDVQDDRSTVDHFDFDDVLECSALRGSEFRVRHHCVGAFAPDDGLQFLGLSLTKVSRSIRVRQTLENAIEDQRARRLTQCRQFLEGVFGIHVSACGNTNEDDLFEPKLSVLDLGDVF